MSGKKKAVPSGKRKRHFVASPLAEFLANASAAQLAEYLIASPSLAQGREILSARQLLPSSSLSSVHLPECSLSAGHVIVSVHSPSNLSAFAFLTLVNGSRSNPFVISSYLQITYANRRCKTLSWFLIQPLSRHSNTRSASTFPQPKMAPSLASSFSDRSCRSHQFHLGLRNGPTRR